MGHHAAEAPEEDLKVSRIHITTITTGAWVRRGKSVQYHIRGGRWAYDAGKAPEEDLKCLASTSRLSRQEPGLEGGNLYSTIYEAGDGQSSLSISGALALFGWIWDGCDCVVCLLLLRPVLRSSCFYTRQKLDDIPLYYYLHLPCVKRCFCHSIFFFEW